MTNRITKKHLEHRVKLLNELFGQRTEAWTKCLDGKYRANPGTFVLDCAYGGYRLGRICNEVGGEHDLTVRGTARETYYAIGAYINGAQAMKDAA